MFDFIRLACISLNRIQKYDEACLEMLCAANYRLSALAHQACGDICCVKRMQLVNVTAFTAK